MRIINQKDPQSSFLAVDKDLNIILDKFLSDERLKRLLYYTTPDALERSNLTEEQSVSLIQRNIINIPKLKVQEDVKNYIIISFEAFVPNQNNPEFRNSLIEIDVICHYDQWNLKGNGLRPYKIAGEIDSLLDGEKLTGIGVLNFVGASPILIDEEFAGLCMNFVAIHGGEDKKGMPNPQDEEKFIEDFLNQVKNEEELKEFQ